MVATAPSAAAAHVALLSHLFTAARLAVDVPSASHPHSTDQSQLSTQPLARSTNVASSYGRETAYYDETLKANITLHLPPSPALPPPHAAVASHARTSTIPLPIPPPSPIQHSSAHHGTLDDNRHAFIPPPLSTLLFSLHVALRAEYVAHANPHAPHQPSQHIPFEPLPTVHRAHAHYQLQGIPGAASNHAHQQHHHSHQQQTQPVAYFSAAWAGNKGPEPFKGAAAEESRMAADDAERGQDLHPQRGSLGFDGTHWTVKWLCDVPVTFVSTPFAPLLSLTAALTLRLSPPLLDNLLSDPTDLAALSSRAFSHSLLAPLHQGPVYPDESTSERLIRMRNSSTLGLDGPRGLGSHLTQLGKEILGGNHTLVTPTSGLEGLKEVERRRKKMMEAAMAAANEPSGINGAGLGAARGAGLVGRRRLDDGDDDGDLGGSGSGSGAGAGAGIVGPRGGLRDGGGSDGDDSQPASFIAVSGSGDPAAAGGLQILKRSSRLVLDVKSGLGVRMRTLFTPFSPFTSRHRYATGGGDGDDVDPASSAEASDNASLVLCVELENTPQSGLDFDVGEIEVRAEQVSGEPRAVVRLLEDGDGMHGSEDGSMTKRPFPMRLEQGQQRNLLYYLGVEDDAAAYHAAAAAPPLVGRRSALPSSGKRNVAIIVRGRPVVLLRPATAITAMERTAEMEPFDSRWNCNLDLSPLFDSARRRTNACQPLSDLSVLSSALPYAAAMTAGARSIGGGPGSNASRPASQQVYPPTAGSVRHSALALEEAFQADRARNLDKLAASSNLGAAAVVSMRGGGGGLANANPRLAAMGNAMGGRSLSFGPSVASTPGAGGGATMRGGGNNDPALARSGSSGMIPQRYQQQQQQVGRGLPTPLTLSSSNTTMRRTPSAMTMMATSGEMTPTGYYAATPRSASLRLVSASSTGGGGGLLYKARQRAISATTTAAASAQQTTGRSRTVVSIGQEWDAPSAMATTLGHASYDSGPPSGPMWKGMRTLHPWTHVNAHSDPTTHAHGQCDGLLIVTTVLPPRSSSGPLPSKGEGGGGTCRQLVTADLTFTSTRTEQGQGGSISTGEKIVDRREGEDGINVEVDESTKRVREEGRRWRYTHDEDVRVEVVVVDRRRTLEGAGGAWTVVFSWSDDNEDGDDTERRGRVGKMLDSDGIKQRYQTASGQTKTLIPLENHVCLPLAGQRGSTSSTTLRLTSLQRGGYAPIPDLIVQVCDAEGHVQEARIVDVGGGEVFVE